MVHKRKTSNSKNIRSFTNTHTNQLRILQKCNAVEPLAADKWCKYYVYHLNTILRSNAHKTKSNETDRVEREREKKKFDQMFALKLYTIVYKHFLFDPLPFSYGLHSFVRSFVDLWNYFRRDMATLKSSLAAEITLQMRSDVFFSWFVLYSIYIRGVCFFFHRKKTHFWTLYTNWFHIF